MEKRTRVRLCLWMSLVFLALFGPLVEPRLGSGVFAETRGAGVDCRVELDRHVLPAGGVQRAVIKITLDAPDGPGREMRPPVNLSLVLDRSGSMTGRKLQKAKEAAIEALRRLGPQDIFSVVTYDDRVKTVVPAQRKRDVTWIEGKIRSIRAGGSTALFGGVSQGASEVRKNMEGDYVHRIVLLSDGLANVGPRTPEDLGRLGVALLKEGISVTTVGVGTDYNEDLMTRLSEKSDGNSYFVESAGDLSRIFAAELGDVLNVVAKRVHLIIDCPDGVRPVSIIGRDGRIRQGRVEFTLNQLYGGQEKFALVQVEIAGRKAGEDMLVADARVSYENMLTQKSEVSYGQVKARFSEEEEKVKESTNITVQRDYELNVNAAAQERAISLSDKGKRKEAVHELKKSSARLKAIGEEHRDEILLEKAEEMEQQAGRIEKEGMTKTNRKSLRTQSYQMKHQQLNK
ncbi:MAG: VWA domain-containing protein [Desulfatiglans sp.]|nr:VWA domain-containing protein [Thermodesulfobacteriota bacterium]MEE4353261.1 VWA domain-containing protein [Desulfatiglans sp.]